MDLEALRSICLDKPGAEESHPFGPGVLVMKVGGKIFAILGEDPGSPSVSLKCEPEIAVALRRKHPAVTAGYHLNKRHWNTVALDGSVSAAELRGWVEDSYDLVIDGLPKKLRARIASLVESDDR